MAKRQGVWADLQRERARRQRLEQQADRAVSRAVARADREQKHDLRTAAQKAAANEREREKLYIEGRKAEAAEMTSDLQSIITELESLLTVGTGRRPGLSFVSLKRTVEVHPFDPGDLDKPTPEPHWDQFAPRPPGAFGRLLGGAARYEQEEAAARQKYERRRTQYAATEADRLRRLDMRRHAYDQQVSETAAEVQRHNTEVEEFERDIRAGDSDAVAQFFTLVLTDLDPVACLKHLNALVSPHPYDLEAVRPVVDFEALLSQYKFVEGMDVVASMDSRSDLLKMTPTEFEHLVRHLFEAMGMKSWVTQASKDDGVDAVAVNEDPVFGGLCIIQAKHYSKAVGIESVRALAGVMEDKHATKGILITTSWVGKDSRDFATRHGRIQLIECEEVKYLCKEHLGLDVLISLPKPPPGRH